MDPNKLLFDFTAEGHNCSRHERCTIHCLRHWSSPATQKMPTATTCQPTKKGYLQYTKSVGLSLVSLWKLQFLDIVHSWTTPTLQHIFGLGKTTSILSIVSILFDWVSMPHIPFPSHSHSHRRRDAFKLDDPRQFLRAIGTVRRQRSPGSSPRARAGSGSVDTNGSETFRVSDKLWRMSLTHVTYHIFKAQLAQSLSLSLYGHLSMVTPCKAADMLYIYIFHGIYPPWFPHPIHQIFTSAMAQDLHIKAFSVNDQDLAALETQLLHQT